MTNRTLSVAAIALALMPIVSLAADGPGRAVYESVCIACHAVENVMVAAPKLGDTAEWGRRLARAANGVETLTDHGVDGYAAMPPKGGKPELTREEVRRAIDYMMAPAPAAGSQCRPGPGLSI